jgi:hypothetical protein
MKLRMYRSAADEARRLASADPRRQPMKPGTEHEAQRIMKLQHAHYASSPSKEMADIVVWELGIFSNIIRSSWKSYREAWSGEGHFMAPALHHKYLYL